MRKPVLIVIAGPNGSGKTSTTRLVIKHAWAEQCVYINPDEIAQSKFGDWNDANAARIAKRVMEGGHDVPIQKIISRHEKAIINAVKVTEFADRAYFYDNSVDNQDALLLYRTKDSKFAKQYTNMLPKWADKILKKIHKT